MTSKICYQINLQHHFGGGEVYTRFFTEALAQLGWSTVLFAHNKAKFWTSLLPPQTHIIAVKDRADLLAHLPTERSLFVTHAPVTGDLAAALSQRHILTGFAHMPLYGRDAQPFISYQTVFAVSRHVLDSLLAAGISQAYPTPMYGVADLSRQTPFPSDQGKVIAHSLYDWDERKLRDRLLGYIEPIYQPLLPQQVFSKKPGISMGIVSRLTPIKQFPLMFEILGPVIRQFPDIHLEIFGSGGYASVRDLKRSLASIPHQVRFWGQQSNVHQIYTMLDYVMTGLPEREALGLNVIEAQACGTPVIAVNAPPFTETILDGITGYLYCDPRRDNGADFRCLLERIALGEPRPDPLLATEHLARFSQSAFTERVDAALESTMAGVPW